jgi:hypothetical protein
LSRLIVGQLLEYQHLGHFPHSFLYQDQIQVVDLNCDSQLRTRGKLAQFDPQLSSAGETEIKSKKSMDCDLLDYDATQYCMWQSPTRLHGVITLKTTTHIFTTVKPSNSTQKSFNGG